MDTQVTMQLLRAREIAVRAKRIVRRRQCSWPLWSWPGIRNPQAACSLVAQTSPRASLLQQCSCLAGTRRADSWSGWVPI